MSGRIVVDMDSTLRYNYRLRPGAQADAALIAEWHRTRWVWNQSVAHLQQTGEWVTDKHLTAWRAEHAWISAGSSTTQQQELRNFRAKRAKGKGRKKFKSARHTQPSLNYTRSGFSLRDGRLRLAGGLSVPVVWSRELSSNPSSVRVYRDSLGHWYASFVVRREDPLLPENDDSIGVDWGVKEIATTTDPDYDLPHPEYAKRAARALARYQRRMARRRPPRGKPCSVGYRAAKRDAAKVSKKVQRQRQDTARKWTRTIPGRMDLSLLRTSSRRSCLNLGWRAKRKTPLSEQPNVNLLFMPSGQAERWC